jgi:WD40 repeat protein
MAASDDAPPNPYPGPRPFETDETGVFHGREVELRSLFSLLVSCRCVILYSQSGAGKTSLVRAGLMPLLAKREWDVLPVARVGRPFAATDGRPAGNVFTANVLSYWKDAGVPTGLRMVEALAALPKTQDREGEAVPRVVVIDQMEELFLTNLDRWTEREAFVEELEEAIEADPLLRVLIGVREDVLAPLDSFRPFRSELMSSRFRLEPLKPAQALVAIENPAKGTGRSYAEGVPAKIVAELQRIHVAAALAGGSDARPREPWWRRTWARIRGRRERGKAVEIAGAYVEPVQLQIVCHALWEAVLPRTTSITAADLASIGNVDDALLRFYADVVVRVSRELRFPEPELRGWFDEELITSAGTRGTVFCTAEGAGEVPMPVIDALQRAHLVRLEDRAGGQWCELSHDRFIGPIQLSNQRWRGVRRRRMQRLTALALGAVAIAVGAASVALQRTIILAVPDTAAAQRARVAARNLLHQADSVLATNPEVAVTLAAQAAQLDSTPQATATLRRALESARTRVILDGHAAPVRSVSLNEDESLLLSTSEDGRAIVWDLRRDSVRTVLSAGHGWATAGAFSPEGKYVVCGYRDGWVVVWDAHTWREIHRFNADAQSLRSLVFSPGGNFLVTTGDSHAAKVWDADTWRLVKVMPSQLAVRNATFSPSARFLVTVSDDQSMRVWSAADWTLQERPRPTGLGALYTVQFSPDRRYIAIGGDSALVIWQTNSFTPVRTILAHAGPVQASAFQRNVSDPAGDVLATGGRDADVRLWSVPSGTALATYHGHRGPIYSLVFTRDGQRLASGSGDGTVRLWSTGDDISGDASLAQLLALAQDRQVRTVTWRPAARR